MKDHKAAKPGFDAGPSSARQRNAIKWCFAGGPMMARFQCYLDPLSPYKKKLDPLWQNFLDPRMQKEYYRLLQCNTCRYHVFRFLSHLREHGMLRRVCALA